MLNPERIAHYLQAFKDLTLSDLEAIVSLSTPRQLAAGEIYMEVGTAKRKVAYIVSGLIRAYQVNEHGDEQTVLLRWEDQFLASYDTILFHRENRFVWQAMEDMVLLETDYESFMNYLQEHGQYQKAKDFFLLQIMADFVSQTESFILLTPEQRYLQFIKEKPNILQRVANKHLASLLGVTPVSLSRIRRRLATKK